MLLPYSISTIFSVPLCDAEERGVYVRRDMKTSLYSLRGFSCVTLRFLVCAILVFRLRAVSH